MLLLPLFTLLCSAELLISRKDGHPLDVTDDQAVIALHHRLMKVQWPTVIAFANKTDDADYGHVKQFLDCIKDPQGRNYSLVAAQVMVDGPYQVRWIPDTIFQISVEKYFEYPIESPERKYILSLSGEGSVPESLEFDPFINRAVSLQGFLDQSIAFTQLEIISSIYVKTLKWFEANYTGRSDWDQLVDELLNLQTGAKQKTGYVSLGLDTSRINPNHGPILKAYLGHEVRAAQSGMFLLSRGASSIKVSMGDQEFRAFDFPGPTVSLSLSHRIMDGSIGDTGVRSLSYLYDSVRNFAKPGYLLTLSINDYIEGFLARVQGKEKAINLFNLLYLPPLSPVGSLVARKEMCHPRTKIGRDVKNPRGFWGIVWARDLLDLDKSNNLSILREQVFSDSEMTIALMNLLAKAEMVLEMSPKYKSIFEILKKGQVELCQISSANPNNVTIDSSGDLTYYMYESIRDPSAANLSRVDNYIAPKNVTAPNNFIAPENNAVKVPPRIPNTPKLPPPKIPATTPKTSGTGSTPTKPNNSPSRTPNDSSPGSSSKSPSGSSSKSPGGSSSKTPSESSPSSSPRPPIPPVTYPPAEDNSATKLIGSQVMLIALLTILV